MFQVHKQQVKLGLYFVRMFFRFLGTKQRLVKNVEMLPQLFLLVLSCTTQLGILKLQLKL
jgi:hypothetical protein